MRRKTKGPTLVEIELTYPMARKSRNQIRKDTRREETREYLRSIWNDPEFRSNIHRHYEIEEEIAHLRHEYEELTKRYPVRPRGEIAPDDPEYPIAIKLYEIDRKIGSLQNRKKLIEREITGKYRLAFFFNPIEPSERPSFIDTLRTLDQNEQKDIEMWVSFLLDTQIIKTLPYQEPRIVPNPQNPQRNVINSDN